MLYALLALAALVIFVLIHVYRQPDEFRVTRSATLPAAPEVVFRHVNDLHLWEHWSPWAKLDPQCKNSFDGADKGEGAIMAWEGNNKVGAGKMTILASRPNEFLQLRLEFFKPFKAVNTTDFTFTPQGSDTLVQWTMYGPNNVMGKCMSLVMNCDKMVGGQFEQGLSNMKQVLEAESGNK